MKPRRPYRLFAAHEATGDEQACSFSRIAARNVRAETLLSIGYRVLTWDVLELPTTHETRGTVPA